MLWSWRESITNIGIPVFIGGPRDVLTKVCKCGETFGCFHLLIVSGDAYVGGVVAFILYLLDQEVKAVCGVAEVVAGLL